MLAKRAAAPTPPWSTLSTAADPKDLVKSVLAGRGFVNENAIRSDVRGSSPDYDKLFALHQALDTLTEVAKRSDEKGVSDGEIARLQKAFTRGMDEVSAYLDGLRFEDMRLTQGQASDKAKMSVGVDKTVASFTTKPVHSGSSYAEVDAFQGDVVFTMSVKRLNVVHDLTIDLSEISGPRTMAAVVGLVNDKLADAGVRTRIATQRMPGEPKQIQVGEKTITIPAGEDQWAFKINGDTTEKVTFSAPTAEPAIYIGQLAGNPDPDGKTATDDGATQTQLLKVQTGQEGGPAEQIFGKDLPAGVAAIRASQTAADGSVYLLAEVDAEVDGQTIKGQRDVALMKYDSAGTLVYTRTLGAAETASGLALAVSADGQVAVAGSVTGALAGAKDGKTSTTTTGSSTTIVTTPGGNEPTKSDSFVTLYDALGQEVWSRRSTAKGEDEATAVAFADDGSVYVAGRTKGVMAGGVSAGNWDGYLRSYTADGLAKGVAQFGTSGDDKLAGLAIEGGNVVVASVEGGRAILRRFDVSGAAPAVAATRDLGGLAGGSIAGIGFDGNGRLLVAGAAGGATLNAGTVTRAYAGGTDAFAVSIAADLSAGAGDSVAYYGGAGADKASAMTVAGGKVWITGATDQDLPGMTRIGKSDGFVVGLDVQAGSVDFQRRFSGKDTFVAPTTIAVDTAGTSVLDRLGLPRGELAYTDSQRITAATSARAGDQFQIKARGGGRPVTVTIEETDTLDTLATKIRRATGFAVKVEIVPDATERRLQIKPLNQRYTAELISGPAGRDALESLGLDAGILRSTTSEDGKVVPADGGDPIFGLKLSRDLSINSKEGLKAAVDALTYATSQLRAAYREISGQNEASQTGPGKKGGTVPTYMTDQLANYQAALARLGGGG
ncbi:MAG: hypothetical protein IT546_14505 [Caulobacteraceae bacterium]|nr:hypothetical protein [Caulobacteraceae bacterium]